MDNYTKFIFMAGPPKAPKRAPSAAPPVSAAAAAAALKKRSVARLKAKQGAAGSRERVWREWMKITSQGAEKVQIDNAKYLALNEIPNRKDKERVFVLLGIVEKFMGGKKAAFDLYISAWKDGKFDIGVIRAFFSKDKCEDNNSSVGFYYGERTFTFVEKTSWSESNPFDYSATGWWAWDAGEDNKNKIIIKGDMKKKNWKGKYVNRKGNGDEWVGDDIIEALSRKKIGLHKELLTKANRAKLSLEDQDSGIEDPQREEDIITELNRLKELPRKIGTSVFKAEILKWFNNSDKKNKWIFLDEKIAAKMTFVFGKDVGKYRYRYVPDKKKIYFMRISGVTLDKNNPKFGYYNIDKDGKLEDKRYALKEAAFKTLISKDVLSDMTPDEVRTELQLGEATSPTASKEALRVVTKGKLKSIVKKKPMKYSALNSDYYSKIEKKLKEKLEKEGKNSGYATKLAVARIEKFKIDVRAWFDGNSAVKEQLEADPNKKITITVDTEDKVSITFRDKGITAAIGKIAGAAEAVSAGTTALKEAITTKYKQIMAGSGMLGSIIGSLGSMIGIDVKADIKEFFKTGKKSMILGILMGVSGVGLSSRLINATPIDSLSKLQQLAKKNGGRLTSQHRIKSAQQLKGLKITIPKGKGIIPGGKFKVKVKGLAGMQKVSPARARAANKGKEKQEGGMFSKIAGMLSGMFGGKGKKGKIGPMFKDREIEVVASTTLPPNTYLPKGTKISVA